MESTYFAVPEWFSAAAKKKAASKKKKNRKGKQQQIVLRPRVHLHTTFARAGASVQLDAHLEAIHELKTDGGEGGKVNGRLPVAFPVLPPRQARRKAIRAEANSTLPK